MQTLLDQIRSQLPENVTDDIHERLEAVLVDIVQQNGSGTAARGYGREELLLGPNNESDSKNSSLKALMKSKENSAGMYSWEQFPAAVLFAFTAVSTIGYGHIYPVTKLGRLCCILYTICGIPLFMISVADIGKFIWQTFKHFSQGRLNTDSNIGELSLLTSVPLVLATFVGYVILGAALIPLWEDVTFMQALYFSVISVTTVGFGDIIPENQYLLPVTMVYIFFGLALTTLSIEVLASALRRFHYLGYPIKGARLAKVWVGGKLLTIDTVLRSMARELGATEDELMALGSHLDRVLEQAHDELQATGTVAMPNKSNDTTARPTNDIRDEHNGKWRYSGSFDNVPESWTRTVAQMEFADEQDDKYLLNVKPDNV